jgi:hypothetical protein
MSSEAVGPFFCECGAEFSSRSELEQHVKEKSDATDWKTHGVKPAAGGPFFCECGAEFSSRSELEQHVKERSDATDWKTHGVKQ